RRDLLDKLVDDGIVVVPDYWPADEVRSMLAASEEILERAKDGGLEDHGYTIQPDIVFRITFPEELVPELAPFFTSPEIRSLADAYISPKAVSFRHELEYRFGIGKQ